MSNYTPLCNLDVIIIHAGHRTNYRIWLANLASRHKKAELILDLRPANEKRRYKVTPSLIGWAQT